LLPNARRDYRSGGAVPSIEVDSSGVLMNEAPQHEIRAEDQVGGDLSLYSNIQVCGVGRYKILCQQSAALLEDFNVSDREVSVVGIAELLCQNSADAWQD